MLYHRTRTHHRARAEDDSGQDERTRADVHVIAHLDGRRTARDAASAVAHVDVRDEAAAHRHGDAVAECDRRGEVEQHLAPDVAALAEAIIDGARLGIDVGAVSVLERYQRWRRFDTMAMGVATDSLNRLFSNNSDVLRLVRDMGLGIVDRMPNLKEFFIRQASGLSGDTPRLLRGEAI